MDEFAREAVFIFRIAFHEAAGERAPCRMMPMLAAKVYLYAWLVTSELISPPLTSTMLPASKRPRHILAGTRPRHNPPCAARRGYRLPRFQHTSCEWGWWASRGDS